MSMGIIGHKCGMTRLFNEDGSSTPVTVVHIEPNKVVQVKKANNDGYNAIQITVGVKKRSRINKAESGHYAKFSVEPGKKLKEFRLSDDLKEKDLDYEGKSFDASFFKVGQKVDVTGISKGKGFQGGVKRHNFKTQDATHGNSLSHRAHGSTGQNQTPGRVFKNKKMAGHMGNTKKTIQSLEVVKIDLDNSILLLKGGIPGSVGGNVVIKPATKVASCKE